ITGLSAGSDYSVTITDSTGCSVTAGGQIHSDCHSVIEGMLFNDNNGNCVYDTGDTPASYMEVMADNNGQTYYGGADAGGHYRIEAAAGGVFQLSVYSWYGTGICVTNTLCGNPSGQITIGTLGDTSRNNNFAFSTSSGYDLTTHPGWTSAK